MSKQASAPSEYHPWATYIYAREEARRRGDRRVGTEHLVLALLREPALADALGSDLASARHVLDAMDREALAGVGIDAELDAPPIPMREPDGWRGRPPLKAVLADRLPLTPAAKATLETSYKEIKRGRSIDPHEVVMLALLSLAPPDQAAALLDALGVDRSAVLARWSDR